MTVTTTYTKNLTVPQQSIRVESIQIGRGTQGDRHAAAPSAAGRAT